VKVALEPAALHVARLDEPGTRAPQLRFVELALGDVHAADEESRMAPVVEERRRRPCDEATLSGRRDPPVLVFPASSLPATDLLQRPPHLIALLGDDEEIPEGETLGQVVVLHARQTLEGGVEPDDVPAGRDKAEEAGRRVDDRAREVALVLELAVSLLELGVQPRELVLCPVALGELTDDEDRLLAGLDDSGFEVTQDAVDRQAVLLGDDLARVDRAPDALDERVGDLGGKDFVSP
jgi:hypothetical protein